VKLENLEFKAQKVKWNRRAGNPRG